MVSIRNLDLHKYINNVGNWIKKGKKNLFYLFLIALKHDYV